MLVDLIVDGGGGEGCERVWPADLDLVVAVD